VIRKPLVTKSVCAGMQKIFKQLSIPGVRENNIVIHTDWGGYGILAPDLDGR
jgi:hypothetical protein